MKLSIITINYNNRIGIEKTIESVISQRGFSDFEFIIIDGGSSDGSKDVIEKYQNSINYWVSEKDKGIYNGMNKGIEIARGEYCIFMNSGDCFYETHVLRDVFLRNNIFADFISGNYIYSDTLKYSPNTISALYLFENSLCHQATFIRTELLKQDYYREDYKIVSDWIQMFDSMVMHNKTYQHVNVTIAQYDNKGLSSINWKLLKDEKNNYLKEILPSRVYDAFSLFVNNKHIKKQSPQLYNWISKINNGSIDEWCVIKLLSIIQTLRKLKHKFKI